LARVLQPSQRLLLALAAVAAFMVEVAVVVGFKSRQLL
jgi:hypothetical protein